MKNLNLWIVLLATTGAIAQDGKKEQGPKVSDSAPNFKAKVYEKDEWIELKDVIKKSGKPIVLIFGSYT